MINECPCDKEKVVDPWCAAVGMCVRIEDEFDDPASDEEHAEYAKKESLHIQRLNKRHRTPEPSMCVSCGVNLADIPSRFCPGCFAYLDHQS